MKSQSSILPLDIPNDPTISALDHILREGAQRLLGAAFSFEVEAFIERFSHLRDELGRQAIVRNGTMPERQIATPVGMLTINQPRVRDRRSDSAERMKFTSEILPRYARRSPTLDVLIPTLYLKGISTGDFSEALAAVLGPNAAGLSPATITRMLEAWQQEYREWSLRDLSSEQYVYLWADGIYTDVRLTDERPCALVLIGATADGRKHLIAVVDGERESTESWRELLLDVKARGLKRAPKIAVADGALGFWSALAEVYPSTRQQLCWVHKIANVLNALPKKLHTAAQAHLKEIWTADTRSDAEEAFAHFKEVYGAKHPKAVATVERNLKRLLAFYDFPAEHWGHLRSSNVIESAFATVRHRTRKTKGNGSRSATLAMLYKLGREAERSWRRLNKPQMIKLLLDGTEFKDGIAQTPAPPNEAGEQLKNAA
jgi:putative transposase